MTYLTDGQQEPLLPTNAKTFGASVKNDTADNLLLKGRNKKNNILNSPHKTALLPMH